MKFEPERINALLGTNLSSEQMLDYLANVELAYDEESNEIIAPTFRHDIFRTADIAEEVARFYGYDNIRRRCQKEKLLQVNFSSITE